MGTEPPTPISVHSIVVQTTLDDGKITGDVVAVINGGQAGNVALHVGTLRHRVPLCYIDRPVEGALWALQMALTDLWNEYTATH